MKNLSVLLLITSLFCCQLWCQPVVITNSVVVSEVIKTKTNTTSFDSSQQVTTHEYKYRDSVNRITAERMKQASEAIEQDPAWIQSHWRELLGILLTVLIWLSGVIPSGSARSVITLLIRLLRFFFPDLSNDQNKKVRATILGRRHCND